MARAFLGTVILLVMTPGLVAAQQLSLMAGRAEYDLSGVETSNIYAVRGAAAASSSLVVEGSVSYIHTRQQFGRSDLWIPEVQLQLHGRWGRVGPYLGVGVGMAIDAPEDEALDTEVELATSVAAGVLLALTERIGVRVDGRLHGIEIDYTGTVTALTAGLVFGF